MKKTYLIFLFCGIVQINSAQMLKTIVSYSGAPVAQKISQIPFYKDHCRSINDATALLLATHVYSALEKQNNPYASHISWALGTGFRQLLHRLSAPNRPNEYGIATTVPLAALTGFLISYSINSTLADRLLNACLPAAHVNTAKVISGLLLFADRNVAINYAQLF